jgi:hypothetical protein
MAGDLVPAAGIVCPGAWRFNDYGLQVQHIPVAALPRKPRI